MDAGTDAALTSLGDPTRARILSLMRASPDGRVLVGRLATELGMDSTYQGANHPGMARLVGRIARSTMRLR